MKTRHEDITLKEALKISAAQGGRIAVEENTGKVRWYSYEYTPSQITDDVQHGTWIIGLHSQFNSMGVVSAGGEI